jgi:arylsulfatase A-like enzyme
MVGFACVPRLARGLGDSLPRLLAFSPSREVGALVACGTTAQIVLLARDPAGAFGRGATGGAFAIVMIAWIWLTVGWAIHLATRLVRGGRVARATTFVLLSLVGAAFAAFEASSWGLYLQGGHFATIDAVMMLRSFAPGSDAHMTALYRSELGRFVVLLLASAALAPSFLAWTLRSRATPSPAAARRVWLYLAVVAALLNICWAQTDSDQTLQHVRNAILRERIDPALTMLVTGCGAFGSPQIAARIDASELVARGPVEEPRATRPRSVIFVKLESTRADAIPATPDGRVVMPNLARLAREGTHFTRAYTNSTQTHYSDPSVHTSLYPLRSTCNAVFSPRDTWPRMPISSWLARAGYSTAFFSSEDMSWGTMGTVLRANDLEVFVDPTSPSHGQGTLAPGVAYEGRDDEWTVTASIAWIAAKVRRHVPFFVTVDLQMPHFPYSIPKGAPRPFVPCEGITPRFWSYPPEEAEVARNRYHNALVYTDGQLGRLVAALERLGILDDTLIAVWGDHGEMFHEVPGRVTHGREAWEGASRVPMLIRAPGLVPARTDDEPVELIDLVPTVCGRLGIPRHPSYQGIDLFSSDRPPVAERTCFVHTHSLFETDAVVLGSRFKLIADRDTGVERLYDLVADPLEKEDASAREPRERARAHEILERWRGTQLAYYALDLYNAHFYAPRFWKGSAPSRGLVFER